MWVSMHPSALQNARLFFETYLSRGAGERVVEIGAQNVNGSIRDVAPRAVSYLGVDFVPGNGVDVVLADPYVLPFPDASVDVCVSSSVFEHAEMFWLLFLEILRVLKPGGLFYLNAPSNGVFHRYPVDCWRFYPDSGKALVKWAERSGVSVAMLESYTSLQDRDVWNDFVAVFVKDAATAGRHPRRILDRKTDVLNGQRLGVDGFVNYQARTEDHARLAGAQDPWQGCHKVRMLAAPAWGDPEDRAAAALASLCASITAADRITVGVVGPPDVADLPPAFVALAKQTVADIVVFPPPDEAGWQRLVGGATAVLLTGPQPALRERARRAGVEVLEAAR